mmetsp:Transcript_66981/g.135031  ORF Transcript_66981/g.135031 Transcript_66981/m.135031 type:complete len:291 (-) Transcript_66981:1039-1911(-)
MNSNTRKRGSQHFTIWLPLEVASSTMCRSVANSPANVSAFKITSDSVTSGFGNSRAVSKSWAADRALAACASLLESRHSACAKDRTPLLWGCVRCGLSSARSLSPWLDSRSCSKSSSVGWASNPLNWASLNAKPCGVSEVHPQRASKLGRHNSTSLASSCCPLSSAATRLLSLAFRPPSSTSEAAAAAAADPPPPPLALCWWEMFASWTAKAASCLSGKPVSLGAVPLFMAWPYSATSVDMRATMSLATWLFAAGCLEMSKGSWVDRGASPRALRVVRSTNNDSWPCWPC